MAFYNKKVATTTAVSPSDILSQKQNQLAAYNAQFESAVSLVTSTIDRLGEIDTSINATIAEIDEYQKGLTSTRQDLDNARRRNEQVVKNFRNLLGFDKED